MANRISKKRLRQRIIYFPAFVSVLVVLVVGGLFMSALISLWAGKSVLREEFQISLFFRNGVDSTRLASVINIIRREPAVKSANFVSAKEGLAIWELENGVGDAGLLGSNPIPNALYIKPREAWVNADSLNKLAAKYRQLPEIRDVDYRQSVLKNIDFYIQRGSVLLGSVSLVLILIAIILIYNTVRLLLYSRRFIIKSMQLVGATSGFIRRPVVGQMAGIGFMAGVFAAILVMLINYWLQNHYPLLDMVMKAYHFLPLIIILPLSGIILSGISAYFAVNKYLKMKLDDLF